jgi:hypothetical protein
LMWLCLIDPVSPDNDFSHWSPLLHPSTSLDNGFMVPSTKLTCIPWILSTWIVSLWCVTNFRRSWIFDCLKEAWNTVACLLRSVCIFPSTVHF